MSTETIPAQLEVSLADIAVSDTNKVFNRDASDFTQDALAELIGSIREQGLVQPVLLRPDPKKAGKFILVAGERRFHACKLVPLGKVPAYVRDITDEQAFDLQLTENIQRKDIHPMREARAYKFLQESKGWSTAELANRFGKSETYVLQRQKLNTLIPEAEKDFVSNVMTLRSYRQASTMARLLMCTRLKGSWCSRWPGPGGFLCSNSRRSKPSSVRSVRPGRRNGSTR